MLVLCVNYYKIDIIMSTVSWIVLSVVAFFAGIFTGVVFIMWLFGRKAQNLQDQFDLTDRKQVENMMGVFGHKPSQEQVNRFIASIKKKKGERSKRTTMKEE